MKDIQISVLITTMDDRITVVIKNLLPQLTSVYEVIISHQITDKKYHIHDIVFPDNVRYIYDYSVGLSKNRNNALEKATGDICYICDDDVTIHKDFIKNICQAYQSCDADVITFQVLDENNYPHFSLKPGPYNKRKILNMASWGITFRRTCVQKYHICFDTRFGLGTSIPLGEENIFLWECFQKGMKLLHSEKPIAFHNSFSSGVDYSNDALIFARMKVLVYMYGKIFGLFSICNLTIKHFQFYKYHYTIFRFFIKNCIAFYRACYETPSHISCHTEL